MDFDPTIGEALACCSADPRTICHLLLDSSRRHSLQRADTVSADSLDSRSRLSGTTDGRLPHSSVGGGRDSTPRYLRVSTLPSGRNQFFSRRSCQSMGFGTRCPCSHSGPTSSGRIRTSASSVHSSTNHRSPNEIAGVAAVQHQPQSQPGGDPTPSA